MPQPAFSPHFCRGHLPVAFVFSAPGAEEKSADKPVSGDAGQNLSFALKYLHATNPIAFGSTHRYDYRISNAFASPIAVSLGHKASEASAAQILESANVDRVLKDLAGCTIVVLCGRKSQLLSTHVAATGITVIHAWHTGNKALNEKYKLSADIKYESPTARRRQRAELWARDVLLALTPQNNVP